MAREDTGRCERERRRVDERQDFCGGGGAGGDNRVVPSGMVESKRVAISGVCDGDGGGDPAYHLYEAEEKSWLIGISQSSSLRKK